MKKNNTHLKTRKVGQVLADLFLPRNLFHSERVFRNQSGRPKRTKGSEARRVVLSSITFLTNHPKRDKEEEGKKQTKQGKGVCHSAAMRRRV